MSVMENKKTSARYFNYRPDEMDEILTPNFIGRHPKNAHTWNLEQHKKYWTDRKANVTIHQQIAEGDWVAVRVSTGDIEMMQLQRFEGAKIAEIWEMYSR
jgi:hypothetical protein